MGRKIGYGWIHIVDSKEHLEKINSYIFKSSDIFIGVWAVIEGSLRCKNSKIIGRDNILNFAILTTTFEKEPIIKMVQLGLTNWNLTAELDELADNELEMADFGRKIKKARYYENYQDFNQKILSLNASF